jgi:hypothetical protein
MIVGNNLKINEDIVVKKTQGNAKKNIWEEGRTSHRKGQLFTQSCLKAEWSGQTPAEPGLYTFCDTIHAADITKGWISGKWFVLVWTGWVLLTLESITEGWISGKSVVVVWTGQLLLTFGYMTTETFRNILNNKKKCVPFSSLVYR